MKWKIDVRQGKRLKPTEVPPGEYLEVLLDVKMEMAAQSAPGVTPVTAAHRAARAILGKEVWPIFRDMLESEGQPLTIEGITMAAFSDVVNDPPSYVMELVPDDFLRGQLEALSPRELNLVTQFPVLKLSSSEESILTEDDAQQLGDAFFQAWFDIICS